jgi:ATP-dependent helicase/nuclease subunit A
MQNQSLQFLAADPRVSTWLSASAGSGKTKVLVDRFVRLLISGEQFSSILCFTYTNAGAIEVKQRVQQRLQEMSESEDLGAILLSLLQRSPTDDELQRARTLFSLLLRNPQALQIKTIHSFCKEFLLEQFGAISESEILSQAEAAKVLTQAQALYCNECLPSGKAFFESLWQCSNDSDQNNEQLLLKKHANGQSMLSSSAYEYLLSIMTFEQIDETLSALLSKRYDFAQFLKSYEPGKFAEMLKKEIGLPEVAIPFDSQVTQRIAKDIRPPDNPTIQLILEENYEQAFLTTTQTLRKKLVGLTRSELYPALYAQAENFFGEVQRQKADEFIRKNQAFVNVASAIFQKYQQIKTESGQCDFDDLTMNTCEIFTKASNSRDLKDTIALGIKHVFIDEAQDTTPQQWQIVLHIVSLFFERDCTLFVVGDAKQSIFGFQGAKPWMFTTLQEVFERLITNVGGTFQRLELNTSYRSVPEVLNLVDSIFQKDSPFPTYVCHASARQDQGFVQCITASDEDLENFEPDADANEKAVSVKDVIIARTALTVSDLLSRQTFCPCISRQVFPNDILVLARQRRDLCKVAEKLFELDVLCESSQNIVWMDFLVFVTFLIDPDDDYNLACLLKSPFLQDYVVSEDQLFFLCNGRRDTLWREILRQSKIDIFCNFPNADRFSGEHSEIHKDQARLANFAKVRDVLTEYQVGVAGIKNSDDFYNFFHRILFHVKPYFAKYYDISMFDVLLDKVLSFLSENMPRLADFREFIQQSFPQSNCCGDGVQLKTIHGAKGSQSPIVILMDIPVAPKEKWVWLSDDLGSPQGVMLMPSSGLAQHLREQELARSNDEEARLLYVAITRAQDAFVLIGKDGAWHNAVKNALFSP